MKLSHHVCNVAVFGMLMAMSAACSSAQFGSGARSKSANALNAGSTGSDRGAAAPKDQVVPPPSETGDVPGGPLDVSKLKENVDLVLKGGPKAGIGEENSQVIDLGCDTAEGVVANVGQGAGMNLIAENALALGDSVQVDKDGNPVEAGTKHGPDLPTLPGNPDQIIPTDAKIKMTVRGKFCPVAQHNLTVLFVLDMSGSMGRHTNPITKKESNGNDPQINGSCGRLEAAKAVIEKIKGTRREGDKISVGLIPFAGAVLTNRILTFKNIDEFSANLTKDVFCQYVVQNASFGYDPQNPGGINGGASWLDASTNYRAALTAAQTVLTEIYGRKAVYFISDGQPTSGAPLGLNPADPFGPSKLAGIAAGESLRQNVKNLEVNTLMLGHDEPDALDVLTKVAGSKDRVRLAANAAELAEQITKFPDATIDPATGLATLLIAPYPAANLGLEYLKPDPATPGIWLYETKPFYLLGRANETVVNEVRISAAGSDGSTHESVVRINYRQK